MDKKVIVMGTILAFLIGLSGMGIIFNKEEQKNNLSQFTLSHNSSISPELSPNRYSEPLPAHPDEKENHSSLLGIDKSAPGDFGYKVRDDLEILIVRELIDSPLVAKYMLASHAYQQSMLELYERSVDQDIYNYLSWMSGTLLACASQQFTTDPDTKEFWNKRKIFKETHFNTLERKIAEQEADGGSGLVAGGVAGFDDDKCIRLLLQSQIDFKKDIYELNAEWDSDQEFNISI